MLVPRVEVGAAQGYPTLGKQERPLCSALGGCGSGGGKNKGDFVVEVGFSSSRRCPSTVVLLEVSLMWVAGSDPAKPGSFLSFPASESLGAGGDVLGGTAGGTQALALCGAGDASRMDAWASVQINNHHPPLPHFRFNCLSLSGDICVLFPLETIYVPGMALSVPWCLLREESLIDFC